MAAGNDSGLGLEDDYGGFFTDLENTKPFMKIAVEGFAGTGKTYTMAKIAIRLWKRLNSKKPIVYVDSEKAGKFLIPLFKAEGIKVLHRETKSFADLMQAMKLCREQAVADILMADSITHFYENYLASYLKKVNRQKLQFEDWGIIKPTWKKEFSEPLVQDPYHILFTGRAGYEYDNEKNPESGKREIFKSGIKMKVEGETAYEPDILILMERFEKVLGDDKQVWREATIIKDRSGLIDGKTFKNPTGDEFMPAIEFCLTSPVTRPPVVEGNTGLIFATEEDRRDYFKRRDILVDEIEALLVVTWPGHSAEEKRAKILALQAGFQTASWTWIKGQSPDLLADGKARIKEHIAASQQMAREEMKTPPAPAAEEKPKEEKAPRAKKEKAEKAAEQPAAPAEPPAAKEPEPPAAAASTSTAGKKQMTIIVEGEAAPVPPAKVEAPTSIENVQAG